MYPASSFAAPLTQAGRPPRTKGGRRLFTIIGAHGYPAQARPRPWLFHACPTATVAEWVAFFRSLAGQPQIVVGDAGHAWQLAVPLAWPSNPPEMVISEFHLREMLDSHIRRLKVPDGDPLIAMTMAAFRGPTDWAVLVAALTPTAQRDARLRAWLAKWDTRVATQLSRHAYRTVTKTTGGIETALEVLERKIHHRRHMFANRARTNLMLKLMTLRRAAPSTSAAGQRRSGPGSSRGAGDRRSRVRSPTTSAGHGRGVPCARVGRPSRSAPSPTSRVSGCRRATRSGSTWHRRIRSPPSPPATGQPRQGAMAASG